MGVKIKIRFFYKIDVPCLISPNNCLFVCLNSCFTNDHQIFVQSIQCLTGHGCMNHDIVIGLCSELLMMLSYHIHLGFGKKAFG